MRPLPKNPGPPAGRSVLLVLLLIAISTTRPASAEAPSEDSPRVFRLNPRTLRDTWQRVISGQGNFAAALAKLQAEVLEALSAGPFTVVTKTAPRRVETSSTT